ncbi:polypeptide N-acetylgalactosaminyltransferase 1-like isoform X2 [Liolophura sinensis]|uniref:polypeptide N-acetylgalactosaminyltransferase 1-like isoform X2 n=1 Tax=Liolophura sinensis TaxID=3198878 RepID=UPI0031591487
MRLPSRYFALLFLLFTFFVTTLMLLLYGKRIGDTQRAIVVFPSPKHNKLPGNAIIRHNFSTGTHALKQSLIGLDVYSNGQGRSSRVKPRTISAEKYRSDPRELTGNSLIDKYGENDPQGPGEYGNPVQVTVDRKKRRLFYRLKVKFNVNTFASDLVALNRMLPDARPKGCSKIKYPDNLPTASIVVPFYDEWPSILLRTVYSIINRTPRHLLKEIVLVDDASTMGSLKDPLDKYINESFPHGIVKIIHLPERMGLIRGRMIGWKHTTSDVIIFFDCHMEVNIDWIQPLLAQIKKNRHTVAMGTLDYVHPETFHYRFYEDYMTRYGFDWKLTFFETFWRNAQLAGRQASEPRIGAVMVGAAFAIDSKYFEEIGAYDEGMDVWGGENLEMAWRVWMCGGRLIHLPCSHIGHIARPQPYSFPGGRLNVEVHNYKRAVDVWMGDYKRFVYDHFPDMAKIDVGDLTKRIKLKEKLQCKNFTWFIDNVWPELNVFDRNAKAWGSVQNPATEYCLDTNDFLFNYQDKLMAKPCTHKLANQGFNWDKSNRLRSSLHCVVVNDGEGIVKLDDCIQGVQDFWTHEKNGAIRHIKTGKCLELSPSNEPIINTCIPNYAAQKWTFRFGNV